MDLEITKIKLNEAKEKVKLFTLDYDGTICGEGYNAEQAEELIKKIIRAGKYAAIITARAATAVKLLYPPLKKFYEMNPTSQPSFIGGGNGTILYEVNKDGLKKVYSHGMDLEETARNLAVYKKIYAELGIGEADLNPKGIKTFEGFLLEDWTGYIPSEYIDLCRASAGKYFTEEAKTTFVLPADEARHPEIINRVRQELGEGYSVKAGDKVFCHITKALMEDTKTVAVKFVLAKLSLAENEAITFGDMPLGNDYGLLSFSYSFTNAADFAKIKDNSVRPPYVLDYPDLSPVAQVYQAIEFLLGNK